MTSELIKIKPGAMVPVIDQNLINSLLPVHQKYLHAALQPKVKELEPLTVVNSLSAIVTGAFTIAGQMPDGNTLALYIDELYIKIVETYPAVTVEEIRIALRSGVYGEYGEYYGINPKSLFSFIKSYLTQQERKEAQRLYEVRAYQLPPVELTEDEKDKSNMEFTNSLYQSYCAEQLVLDFTPTFIFDFLERKEILVLTITEKNEIKARAVTYHLNTLASTEPGLNNLLKYMATNNSPEIERRIIARRIALHDYFKLKQQQHVKTIFEL